MPDYNLAKLEIMNSHHKKDAKGKTEKKVLVSLGTRITVK
jgi:hypothetical protein